MSTNATAKLPTQAGRKALLSIAASRPCRGIYQGTMQSLLFNGLIDHQNTLTESGQQMVNRLTITPEVSHG